jgi:pantoate--beta-alanine ligase
VSRVVKLAETAAEIRRFVAEARHRGKKVGLVPTMGALHEGHTQLIKDCCDCVDLVVVSIFVNPTQFGAGEDFDRYPRPLDQDVRQCAAAGADVAFVPSSLTIYPHGPQSTVVEVLGISDVLEGASRPGHFRGVATVVLKLFELVRPDLAIFGQKDFQQQLMIRRMVEDLHVPVELKIVPTIREPDGLALSSRNRYLSWVERQAAPVLNRALERARAAVDAGEYRAAHVRQILHETLESEPLVTIEYAEVADAETLQPLADLSEAKSAVALVAARLGTTRLIDNTLLPVVRCRASVERGRQAV